MRMQIIKLKKNIDNLSQNTSNFKGSNESDQSNKQLITQNQQMAKTIQELKNAAISAIMAKDDQIQELNEKIIKAEDLAVLYQNLLDREQSLQKQIQKIRTESEEQQKILSEKLTKQREKYLQKLQQFQHNLHHEESSKQQLLEKTQHLENNLQSKQQIIYLYQNKLNQFEGAFRQQKQLFEQQKDKLFIEIDNLKDKISLIQKQIINLQKSLSQYTFKERESKILTQRLKDENGELERKLSIKKRKNNSKMRSSDIYSSFQGISQKSSFYSSFYKPTQQTKPTTLGQIQQLQENDVLDSFIDLEERVKQNDEENIPMKNYSKNKEKALEIDLSETQNQETECQAKASSDNQTQLSVSSFHLAELDRIKESLKQNQAQIYGLKQRNETLRKKLDESYVEIERLTKDILTKTSEIQNERQTLAQLRSQNKKSQAQKELIVQLQNFKQHVFKLENALLIQKLQNAEKEEFMKQRTQRERKNYEDKINKLGDQIKNLSPKKKKGFFR